MKRKLRKWQWYRRDRESWIRKMSDSCSRKWANSGPRSGDYDTVESRVAMARMMTLVMNQHLAEKTGLTFVSNKGTFKNNTALPYRNDLQKKAFEALDSNPGVTSYRFLDDAIEVSRPVHLRKKRPYNAWMIVDFIVEYKSGSKKFIFLKPKGIDLREMLAFRDAEKYCSDHNYEIEIWTNDQFAEQQ